LLPTQTSRKTNLIKGRANNGTLELDGSARPLTRRILADTLLVQAAPRARPCQLGGLLALQKQAAALARDQMIDLSIF
jgi:hypothetical protein